MGVCVHTCMFGTHSLNFEDTEPKPYQNSRSHAMVVVVWFVNFDLSFCA